MLPSLRKHSPKGKGNGNGKGNGKGKGERERRRVEDSIPPLVI